MEGYWNSILGVSYAILAKLEKNYRDHRDCLRQVFFDHFIENKPQRYSQDWNGLFELLDDVGFLILTHKLKSALLAQI